MTNDWALGVCCVCLFFPSKAQSKIVRTNKLDIVSKSKEKLQLWLHSNMQICTQDNYQLFSTWRKLALKLFPVLHANSAVISHEFGLAYSIIIFDLITLGLGRNPPKSASSPSIWKSRDTEIQINWWELSAIDTLFLAQYSHFKSLDQAP